MERIGQTLKGEVESFPLSNKGFGHPFCPCLLKCLGLGTQQDSACFYETHDSWDSSKLLIIWYLASSFVDFEAWFMSHVVLVQVTDASVFHLQKRGCYGDERKWQTPPKVLHHAWYPTKDLPCSSQWYPVVFRDDSVYLRELLSSLYQSKLAGDAWSNSPGGPEGRLEPFSLMHSWKHISLLCWFLNT